MLSVTINSSQSKNLGKMYVKISKEAVINI